MTPPYLSDDVTVGELVRWINDQHLSAARETPPNLDYMRAMQELGGNVEDALGSYRNFSTAAMQGGSETVSHAERGGVKVPHIDRGHCG